MRVLHVISSVDPRTGGTIATVEGLAQSQAALGTDVTIASTWARGEDLSIRQRLAAPNIHNRLIGPTYGKLGWHKDLKSIIQSLVAEADIVHIHALWEEIQHQTARACQRQGKPYVLIPHGMLDPWSMAQHRLKKTIYMFWRLRRNLNAAAALHFTTETERDLVTSLHLRSQMIVEPPGLDLREFQTLPPRGTFRNRYPELAGKKIVLFLSRIHYKKGLDLLIPAFARAGVADAMLVIAGPDHGGYRSTVEKLIAAHGLADRVVFTGMLHGAARVAAMADADLFALTSYQENFGIVVTESLAAGTPVLISDQVNIHREVTAAQVGAVVPCQIEPIARELSRWLTDESLRKDTAARARPWVWERYDWKRIAARWEGHYQRLMEIAAAQNTVAAGGLEMAAPRPAVGAETPLGGEFRPAAMPPMAPIRPDALRILHVIPDLSPEAGGPIIALKGLVSAQRTQGNQVSVLATWTTAFSLKFSDAMRTDGIGMRMIGPVRGRLGRHPLLAAAAEEMVAGADIVHIHAIWEEVQHRVVQAALRANVPYIIRPAGMLDPWSLRQHWLRKRIYMAWRLRKNLDGADAMHFTSNLERDLVRKLRLRAPAIVEPNGVDLMEFQTLPPRGQFRNIHPELAGKPMLLFLSRLHYKKGLDLLVPALARARTRDAMLVIAGPDNDGYRAKVESMAREHGVLGRLLFPGMLYGQDRIAALADADLFVLPSYQENFGIAVVEALAAGTPVLISDQVNIFKEIFDAGVGGVVPTRVDALADELTRWMNDDALRATAAARTRAFVWARYNWQGIAQHWQECYRRLIAGHASRDDRMYANALSS